MSNSTITLRSHVGWYCPEPINMLAGLSGGLGIGMLAVQDKDPLGAMLLILVCFWFGWPGWYLRYRINKWREGRHYVGMIINVDGQLRVITKYDPSHQVAHTKDWDSPAVKRHDTFRAW